MLRSMVTAWAWYLIASCLLAFHRFFHPIHSLNVLFDEKESQKKLVVVLKHCFGTTHPSYFRFRKPACC